MNRLNLMFAALLGAVFRWPALLLALLLGGVAQAQAGVPTVDPAALGKDVGTLGLMIMFTLQMVKKQRERLGRPFKWYETLLLALLMGEGAAALLFYNGYGARFGSAPPPWTWMIFGAVAAGSGAGLRDLLMAYAERGRATVTVQNPTVPALPTSTPDGQAGLQAPPDIAPPDPSFLPGFQADPSPDPKQTLLWLPEDDAPLVYDGDGGPYRGQA